MKRIIAVLLSCVIAAGAGAGAYYLLIYKGKIGGGRVSSVSEDAVYVDPVTVIAGIGTGSGQVERYAGVVEPQDTWDVKVDGDTKIEKTYVKVGDEVKQGDPLFKYDTTESEQKIAQDEIDVERDKNNIETDTKTIEEYKKQLARATTESDRLEIETQILQKENDIKTTEYEIKSKELEISQLKERIASAEVTSEIDGTVRTINSQTSSSSSYSSDGSSDAYMTIMANGDFRVKGTLNEQQMGNISAGDAMIVYSRVEDGKYWKGSVEEIRTQDGSSNNSNNQYGQSGESNISSTNYPFYIQLEDSSELILGQHVYMEPDVGQEGEKEGIWIPDYYFTQDEGGSWIWAASKSNTLEKRKVTLGEYDEEMMTWSVTEGLTEEDYIIVPSDFLKEGLPVIYNEASADPAAWDEGEVSGDEEFDIGAFDGDADMEVFDGDADMAGDDFIIDGDVVLDGDEQG